MDSQQLRLAEFVATLALAQDNAFGQPLESQLRSCLLASWICEAAGFEQEVRETAYWVALLRYVGCTGHAHEVATVVRRRDRDPRPDARPRRRQPRRGDARRGRVRDGRALRRGARRDRPDAPGDGPRVGGAQLHVGVRGGRHARAAARLRPRRPRGAGLHLRALERQGLPHARRRRGDPARRCASCTSATTWRRSAASSRPSARSRPPATAATARTTRRSPTCSSSTGAAWFDRLRETEPWDAVLALEPEPRRMLEGEALDDALAVAADFIDLKSPYMGGHSRRCAQLADRRRPGARARRRRRSRRSAGRRSCTTSAPPRCRTRSGTSRAR